MKLRKTAAALVPLAALLVTGCSGQAGVAAQNVSREADDFKVDRRIVAVNLITDKYLLEVRGKCSIETEETKNRLMVICKTGANPDRFVKQWVGFTPGAQVAYTIEQTNDFPTDSYRYQIFFRPEQIVPVVVG